MSDPTPALAATVTKAPDALPHPLATLPQPQAQPPEFFYALSPTPSITPSIDQPQPPPPRPAQSQAQSQAPTRASSSASGGGGSSSAPNQTVVLITSCMQNDFFHRFPRRRDSMNRYWVGRKDSERVLGFDPARGPFSQLINFVRAISQQWQQQQQQQSRNDVEAHDRPALTVDLDAAGLGVGAGVDGVGPSPGEEEDDEYNHEMEEAEDSSTLSSEPPLASATGAQTIQHQHQQQQQHRSIGPGGAGGVLRIDVGSSASSGGAGAAAAASSLANHAAGAASVAIAATMHQFGAPPTAAGLGLSPLMLPQQALNNASTSSQASPALGAAGSGSTAVTPGVSSFPTAATGVGSGSSGPSRLTPIHVIHLRTSIDRRKERGRSAIERYGEYCLSGTEGARLCCNLEDDIEAGLYPNEHIIDTTRTLSSNSYRPLLKKLREIHGNSRGPLRVAVIGGWTDEDVYHVCYELKTRTKAIDIATCTVLTASPSTSQHWNSLGQMKRVIGVTLTRTVRELVQWFGVGAGQSTSSAAAGMLLQQRPAEKYWPTFIWNSTEPGGGGGQSNGCDPSRPPRGFNPASDGEILAHLYRNSSRIIIDVLVGSFADPPGSSAGGVVLGVRSYDKSQVREAPSVLKIARAEDVATEYQAFHRVEEMLGNNAPSVRGFVELGDRAGIKFRYTRMTGGKVCSMADLFADLAAPGHAHLISCMLDEIFAEIFQPWYAGSRPEFFDLFAYWFDGYTLSLGRVWNAVKKVDRVHCDPAYLQQFITYCLVKGGTDPAPFFKEDKDFYNFPPHTAPTFTFPGCDPLANLGGLFARASGVPYLRTLPPQKLYACFSHGNATLENFMCEGAATGAGGGGGAPGSNGHAGHSHSMSGSGANGGVGSPPAPSMGSGSFAGSSASYTTVPPLSYSSSSSQGGASGYNGNSSGGGGGAGAGGSGGGGGGGIRGNVWIVDFFHTEARNHCLRDVARTWCCIMYAATELHNDHQFAQAVLISSEMARARDLCNPLAPTLPGLTDLHLRTIYSLLCRLWRHAGRIVKDRSAAVQFQMGLLADSMRFFLYRARNIYSKRWALSTSVFLLESILWQEKRIHDIKPSWVPLTENSILSAVRGKLGLTRCPGNRDFIRFEKKYPQVVSAMGAGGTAAVTAAAALAHGKGMHPAVLEAQRVQLPPEVAAGLGAGGAPTTLSLSHSHPPAVPSAVRAGEASSTPIERGRERGQLEHERRNSLSSSAPNSQAPSLPPSLDCSLSSTPNALSPQGSKVASPQLRPLQAGGGNGASIGSGTSSSSSSGLVSSNLALLPPPRVVVARYGRENPSLLPPNEDPRQMEALERAQVIREQMEAAAREEQEEEEKAKREQQMQALAASASSAAAGTVSSHQLPPYETLRLGTGSLDEAGVGADLSGGGGGVGGVTDASLAAETRSKRKKDAAEVERKEKHARMLLEQEHERARYEKAQAQKRAAAALARQAAAAGGAGGLLSPPREDEAATTGDADEEIEQEMIAAAELERLREEEAAGRMRLRSDSNGCVVGLLASSVSSGDLALAASGAPPHHLHGQGVGGTRCGAAAGGAVLVPPPKALMASFSTPHLPALALSGGSASAASATDGAGAGVYPPSLLSHHPVGSLAAAAAFSSGTKQSRIEREVGKLSREGTTHVMLLLSESDFTEMGVEEAALHRALHEAGIKRLQVSVAPGPLQLPLLIDLVQIAMSVLCEQTPPPPAPENKLLLISKSGFRRAGTLAACILCAFGLPVDTSVRVVRDARGSRSLGKESRDQLVRKFDREFKKFLIERVLHSGELFHSAINRYATNGAANSGNNAGAAAAATPTTHEGTAAASSASATPSTSSISSGGLVQTPLPFTPQLRATDSAYALETPGLNRSQIKIWPAKGSV